MPHGACARGLWRGSEQARLIAESSWSIHVVGSKLAANAQLTSELFNLAELTRIVKRSATITWFHIETSKTYVARDIVSKSAFQSKPGPNDSQTRKPMPHGPTRPSVRRAEEIRR